MLTLAGGAAGGIGADDAEIDGHGVAVNDVGDGWLGPARVRLMARPPTSGAWTVPAAGAVATLLRGCCFAIAAHADEREAHIREVQSYAQTLPKDSYGHRNRQAMATRDTRIAARLRAVEHAYRMAIEREAAFMPPEPARASRSPESTAENEIELD